MAVVPLRAVVSALVGIANSANCYNVDGILQDADLNWRPCNPNAEISPCCNKDDYCLDNGLCLNAGSSKNLFTVQGCTDPKCGAPCQKYCSSFICMSSQPPSPLHSLLRS